MAGELVAQVRGRAHNRGLARAEGAIADGAGVEDEGGSPQIGELAVVFEDPVWAEVFWACCCDTGEAPSVAGARTFYDALLAQNPDGQKDTLSLRCLRIGASAVSQLGQQLKDRNYTRVDLSENQLGDNAVLSIRSLIRALPSIRWLGLAGNVLGPDGAEELAEELESNTTLMGLGLGALDPGGQGARCFRPNTLGSAGINALLGALLKNPRPALTSLTLAHTSLGLEAARHLASFLEKTELLQSIDLSSNPLTSEGVAALLPHCTRLRLLDISDTGCRGDLIQTQLCTMLQRSPGLVKLMLARNPLEARPLRRIAKGLAACTSLVTLSLESTSLGTEGVCALAEALLAAPVTSITDLDLSGNQLSQMVADVPSATTPLARLVSRAVLTVLRLNRNPLGDIGVRELAMVLGTGCALQQLELCRCRVSTVGADHLLNRLATNDTLRVLRLGDNFLDDNMDMRLLDALPYVQELNLVGNRLSHATLKRAEQVCVRNRQAARDEEPLALREEMHRLLFQETKLGMAREQIAAHDEKVQRRQQATDHAVQELKHLRAAEAEAQRLLSRQIAQEERELEDRRTYFAETNRELANSTARYEAMQHEMRQQLREREQALVDLQGKSEEAEQQLGKKRQELPKEVERIKARIKVALEEAEQLKEQERAMKKQLLAMQEKSLIGFKP